MRIIDLILKDLSQLVREKRTLLFLVVMPVAFTFFMGFAYRGVGDDGDADPRIALAVVDPEPDADLNQEFYARLERSDSVRPIQMDEFSAMEALSDGEVAGVLVFPVGFSERWVGGETAQLSLIADPTTTEGQALYQILRAPVSQLLSAVEVSRETVDIITESVSVDPVVEQPAAFELAWGKWEAASQVDLVRHEQAVAEDTSDWTGGNPYNQSSPGILVQFAIFGLVNSAQVLVLERKTRTLQRMMTTSMPLWEIIAGHLLAMFVVVFVQTALLVVFGQWVLGVDYFREPVGTLLIAVTLGLWVASMGLLIGVQAKGDDQVILYSMVAMFGFSALGGAWFPLEVAGGAFAAFGKVMPSAYAMNGLQNILIRGLGLESIWLPAGVLMAYALAFFAAAVWRFGKNEG